MESKTKLGFLIVGTILLFLLFAILLFMFLSQRSECINSPFTYGAEKISKNDLEVTCTCYFNDFRYAPFYFNKENISVGTPLS